MILLLLMSLENLMENFMFCEVLWVIWIDQKLTKEFSFFGILVTFCVKSKA